MPRGSEDYFDSNHPDYGRHGGPDWNREVFRRAFVVEGGAFEQVVRRLALGFSVLVYLPGNCIRAAADHVLRTSHGRWRIYGRAENAGDTLAEVWRGYTGLFETFSHWFDQGQEQPQAIFENLDLLSDGRGGLDQSNEAKTALFYLTECVRNGVVLGLSDLRAGELPEAVRRPFSEEVFLTDVPFERFRRIVPRCLVKQLTAGSPLPSGASWLLASRLRWTDPLRSVRIMETLSGDLGAVLAGAAEATRTTEFTQPCAHPEAVPRPSGFEADTIELLEHAFIRPYRAWASYRGEDYAGELRRLPRGLILFGPPGTGKTTLARWVAESIGIPARQVTAADLKRSDWGLTERMVRDLFASARRAAPCVIVLDDADDLLRDRKTLIGELASAEGGVVNAFLKEIEGYSGPLQGVLVILTTNQFHRLDAAARSRLARHVLVPYPLAPQQVSEIVESAREYYGLPDDPVLTRELESFFFKPTQDTTKRTEEPEVRRGMESGLFAPRDILAAMQLLVDEDPIGRGLPRMQKHYERLRRLNLPAE
jgi:hypothetical protein